MKINGRKWSVFQNTVTYGNIVWGSRYKLDLQALKKVQWHATKPILSLYDHPYEDRLHILNLASLYYRRKTGDTLEIDI